MAGRTLNRRTLTTGRARSSRGFTLLEVMLAVAVMAVAGLGIALTHLTLARNAQWATARERAAFVADAIAEAAREDAWELARADGAGARQNAAGIQTADQWKARAATILPLGAVSEVPSGMDTSAVVVTWSAIRWPQLEDQAAAARRACDATNVPAGRACVFLAFVK